MNIKQALAALLIADVATGDTTQRVCDLPAGDIVVQRSLLRSALREINTLEDGYRDLHKIAASGESDIRAIGPVLALFSYLDAPKGEDS